MDIRRMTRLLVAAMAIGLGGCQAPDSDAGGVVVKAPGHAATLRGGAEPIRDEPPSGSQGGMRTAAAVAAGGFHFAPEEIIRLGEVGEIDAVAVADVDGDSRKDVIVATGFVSTAGFGVSRKVLVFRQSDHGTLLPRDEIDYRETPDTPDIATGDMDRDGRSDIIVGHRSGITVVRYVPGAGYTAEVDYGSVCDHVAVLDIDLDGAVDVACEGEGLLAFYYNNGRGGIRKTTTASLGSYGWMDLKAVDVTGDGRADLVLFRDDDKSELRVYPHAAGAGFAPAVIYPFADNAGGATGADASPWGMAAGDFNADGRTDLAISMSQAGPYFNVIQQGSDGRLLAPISIQSPRMSAEMVVADFDGDGDQDVVAGYPGWALMGYFPQSGGRPGSGTDIPLLTLWGGHPNNQLAAGDINGDECPDLVRVDGIYLGIVKGVGCGHKVRHTGGPAQRSME